MTSSIINNCTNHAASLNNSPNNLRTVGECYLIISSIRGKRVKYIANDLTIKSTDKFNFNILDKKYLQSTKDSWLKRLEDK